MRPLFALIITTLLTASGHGAPGIADKVADADKVYLASKDKTAAVYRKAFSEAIGGATKIEVYLLDFETIEAPDSQFDSAWAVRLPEDQFPIVPYGRASKILKHKLLSPDEIKLLMPSLKATIGVEKNYSGPMCHFPIHGIRMWDGEDIIFQTSLCYECANFYMIYPFGDADWTSLSDPNIKTTMERFMPIPKSETDRFDAKYKSKKTTTKQ